MRKIGLVGILAVLVLVGSLCPTLTGTAIAATTDYITITATGAEVNIVLNVSAWNVGYVYASDVINTTSVADPPGLDWARLTNNGGEAVDVTVAGRSMKDSANDDTWTLSNTATAGADTFGMYAGKSGDDYNIVIKNVGETLNQLVDELAASGTQDFGLEFHAPTSMSTFEEMEMVGAVGNHDDDPRGLVFTGSVD